MRVLPAAVLGLLSAASSVLPSAASNRRKLSDKAGKSSVGCPAVNDAAQAELLYAIRLTSVATSLFALADVDNSGTITPNENEILQKIDEAGLIFDFDDAITFDELVNALNELYAGGSCSGINELQDAIFDSIQMTLAVAQVQGVVPTPS